MITLTKVFLSAGHGGSDPGAVAYGMKEKDINLDILLACRDELMKYGITVVCSRVSDANDPVAEEVKEANASKADISVSFHTNAGGGNGSETYYYKTSTKGKKLADVCEKHIKSIGQNSRGSKSTTNLYFLKHTSMPAVLCECAFIDNDSDNNIIDSSSDRKEFGRAYARAILEYFGIPVKKFTVQIGSFSDRNNADKLVAKAKSAGFSDAFITES
jgi:N-acetylmuramoyl-L-alanine amidase